MDLKKVISIEELKKKAQAVNSGTWNWHADPIKGDPLGRSRYEVTTTGRTITRTYYNDPEAEKEAQFIAAANPQTVLALIAEIERLREERARYLDTCRPG